MVHYPDEMAFIIWWTFMKVHEHSRTCSSKFMLQLPSRSSTYVHHSSWTEIWWTMKNNDELSDHHESFMNVHEHLFMNIHECSRTRITPIIVMNIHECSWTGVQQVFMNFHENLRTKISHIAVMNVHECSWTQCSRTFMNILELSFQLLNLFKWYVFLNIHERSWTSFQKYLCDKRSWMFMNWGTEVLPL